MFTCALHCESGPVDLSRFLKMEETGLDTSKCEGASDKKRNKVETEDDVQLRQENGQGDKEGNEPETMSITTPDSSEYFASYEDLNVHRLMLEDKVRTNAYLEAITNASSLFQGKMVMDVGAGTGILSLFCAKAGAKKVYAVEASSLSAVISEVASKNGFGSIINVIHSRVEEITEIEETQVDIIVSEWMGFYLLHESMLESVIHARNKFLRSGGHMFPNTAQIYAAPCTAYDLWRDNVGFWSNQQLHYGFDLSPFQKIAKNICKPLVEIISPDNLLSDPQLLFDLNLQTVEISALQSFRDRRFFSTETGDMHAVCIWFSCTFPAVPEKEPVELSTAPWTAATHWKQTVILLPDKTEFEEGDISGWELKLEKSAEKDSRSYTIEFQCLDAEEEHPVPCECGMVKCEIIKQYLGQSQTQST